MRVSGLGHGGQQVLAFAAFQADVQRQVGIDLEPVVARAAIDVEALNVGQPELADQLVLAADDAHQPSSHVVAQGDRIVALRAGDVQDAAGQIALDAADRKHGPQLELLNAGPIRTP